MTIRRPFIGQGDYPPRTSGKPCSSLDLAVAASVGTQTFVETAEVHTFYFQRFAVFVIFLSILYSDVVYMLDGA